MTDCTCPREMGSIGRLDDVSMGRGMVRTATTTGCPVHDTCQHYTAENRAQRPAWSNPWCPIHEAKPCPR